MWPNATAIAKKCTNAANAVENGQDLMQFQTTGIGFRQNRGKSARK